MYIEEKSYKDHAKCIKSLIDTCTTIIAKHKYSDEDIRTIAFANMRSIGYSSILITNLLDSWTIGDEMIRQSIPQLIGLTEVTEKSVKLAGESLQKTTKLSLILLSQFQIENFLHRVANTIGCPSKGNGFYDKTSNLISFLDLDTNLIDELNVSALIRNSLHSNGIHHAYKNIDLKINLDGVDYEFIHERKVSCASMPHIAHALENSARILDQILDHKKIKDYKNEIHDEYRIQTK